MHPILFSIPDSVVVLWLCAGFLISAYVDYEARTAGLKPFCWKEWLMSSLMWPLTAWNICKAWKRSLES